MALDTDYSSGLVDNGSVQQSNADTYLTFAIGNQIFAVDVRNVREILDLQTISQLPNAPHDVMGVIDVRHQGIGVIDLASRLGMCLEDNKNSRIVVFEVPSDKGIIPIGVIADRVLSVAEITANDIEVPPATLSAWDPSAVKGVARVDGQMVILLLLSKVFGVDDFVDDAFDFKSV